MKLPGGVVIQVHDEPRSRHIRFRLLTRVHQGLEHNRSAVIPKQRGFRGPPADGRGHGVSVSHDAADGGQCVDVGEWSIARHGNRYSCGGVCG